MEQIIKTLPTILRAGGYSTEVVEAAAIAAWKHLAGDNLSNQAVATKLAGKTLVIAIADAIWQKQLESIAGQLLFRLNSALGQPLISRLEFYIDPEFAARSCQPSVTREAPATAENEVSLELWSAANAIQDKQLRKVFLAAATSNLRRRERQS
jgi:hypothetical protein